MFFRTPYPKSSDELAFLTNIWAKVVREERPHFVTMLGDPGIGKSRLVAEFEARVLNEALVFHGRCLPYARAKLYGEPTAALPISEKKRGKERWRHKCTR